MTMRTRLLGSADTAVARTLSAIQWLELFMMESVRGDDWNTGPGIRWLVNNPHPMFYSVSANPDGHVQITCTPGIVGRRLKINRPGASCPN